MIVLNKNKILLTSNIVICILFSSLAQAHQGSSGSEPRLVCADKALGDACDWKDNHNATYIGTCRAISTSLLCVRNKPIVYPKEQDHEGSDKT